MTKPAPKVTHVAGVEMSKPATHQFAKRVERAVSLFNKGMSTKDVASVMDMNKGTIYKWRHDFPELKGVLSPSAFVQSGEDARELGLQTRWIAGIEVPKIGEVTARKIENVVRAVQGGETLTDALKRFNLGPFTLKRWRTASPEIDELVVNALERKKIGKKLNLVDPNKELRDKGSFAEFRMEYFGRPTLAHQEPIVQALEDRTNLVVIVLAPPGSGKDTIAGDWIAYELADDRAGVRVAWIMESENFARRRLQRLGAYFTDPTIYRYKPSRTPGGRTPNRSLIDDFGPYRWEKDLEFADGSRPERRPWNQNQMYFVQVETPEADPNLWATGVDGATYGARIDVAVLSDPFTEENQLSPTMRVNQMSFIEGTLDSRLDEGGRLIVLGTMLEGTNNYEALIDRYTTGARVIASDGIYTKYSNGTAVVMHPAVLYPDGEEASYWEDRFPMDAAIVVDGERFSLAGLDEDEQYELLSKPGAERLRGLRERRDRNPRKFEAMYNQNRSGIDQTDFTEETLNAARVTERTYGTVYPTEIPILGVDPARRFGAGWVLWAVDPHRGTATVADLFYGDRLGYDGIKQKLIVNPVTQYQPAWLVFEGNIHGGVLSDPLISRFLEQSGTALWMPRTTSQNRGSKEIGPASMSAFMRAGTIRFPYATPDDRRKTALLESHFQAWDRTEISSGRTRPGHKHHAADDLAMAAWVGWLKVVEVLEGKIFGYKRRPTPSMKRPVPASVERSWRASASKKDDGPTRHAPPSIDKAITIMSGVE